MDNAFHEWVISGRPGNAWIFSLFMDSTRQAEEFDKSVHESYDQVPQVSGKFWSGNKDSPHSYQHNGVKTVADVS